MTPEQMEQVAWGVTCILAVITGWFLDRMKDYDERDDHE